MLTAVYNGFKHFTRSILGLGILFQVSNPVLAEQDIESAPDAGATTLTQAATPVQKVEPKTSTRSPSKESEGCSSPDARPDYLVSELLPSFPTDFDSPLPSLLQAQQVYGTRERFYLEGDVRLEQGSQSTQADFVTYDKRGDHIEVRGNVLIQQPGLSIRARSGRTNIAGDRGVLLDTQYDLNTYNARGEADKIEIIDFEKSKLEGVSYTTCHRQERDWELKAQKVRLDQKSGEGVARNLTLELKGIPFLYLPYLSFPIDDRRKTGFLTPSFGRSDQSGADTRVPFYWNIAPQQDATITPRLMSERGTQLNTNYRYLFKYAQGELDADYLPSDDKFGDDRYKVTLKHTSHLGQYFHNKIVLNHVSDPDYFHDLGNSLSDTSVQLLERRFDLTYLNAPWLVLGRLQNFQPLNNTAEVYQRLPQLTVATQYPSSPGIFNLKFYGEWVQFEHEEDVTKGSRLDVYPTLSTDLYGAAYFTTARLGWRVSQYNLESEPDQVGTNTDTRNLPIFSLDSGLFLERDFSFKNQSYIQTLEPRIYYLYVPFRDQSEIPIFDTALLDFSFAQLFRENRFIGADRIGDANQISTALTSRFLHSETGWERLRTSIGAIHYFSDRRVTLPNQNEETREGSDLIAEVSLGLKKYAELNTSVQWNPEDEQTEKSVFELRFRKDRDHILNLSFRSRRADQLRQTDISFLWPIYGGWKGIGHWQYSLKDQQTQEALIGLEYERCCWAVRIVGRRYINETDLNQSETNSTIYLQLVLKGLSALGDDIEQVLEHGILGYGALQDVE